MHHLQSNQIQNIRPKIRLPSPTRWPMPLLTPRLAIVLVENVVGADALTVDCLVALAVVACPVKGLVLSSMIGPIAAAGTVLWLEFIEVPVGAGPAMEDVAVDVVFDDDKTLDPGRRDASIPLSGTILSVTCGPSPGPHCKKVRVVETLPAVAAVTVVVGMHVVVMTPRFDWNVLPAEI